MSDDFESRLVGKHILSVDDSSTIRKYLRNILSPYGVKVAEAASGDEALDILKSEHDFDMVILDLQMPGMNGIEVLEALRTFNTDITVVVLTGQGDIRSASLAVKAGADGYIEKHYLPQMDHHDDLFYALGQSLDHRAGIVAQRQLEELKADFYSMVTHDLRNPAGTILMAIDVLLEETFGPLNAKQMQLLEMTKKSSDKLLGLVSDYLDFAKIDAGFLRLDRSDTDLKEVINEVVEMSQLQAQAKKHTLTADLPEKPLMAFVDGERLQQVLENLLSNAIKYTPDGGAINVSLKQDKGDAIIAVQDNGPGVPKDQLPALFAKYYRVPGKETKAIKGTGLGLVIVKEIVEGHGGVITAESEGVPGKGTTFTVRLPLESPPES